MTADHSDLLQGTLEMLVLKTLSLEPMHGWGSPTAFSRCPRKSSRSIRARSTRPCNG